MVVLYDSASKRKWALVSFLLYLISLALPTFTTIGENDQPMFGYEVLLWGWAGLINLEIRWYANLLYFYLAVCMVFGFRVRVPYFVVALLIGFTLSVFLIQPMNSKEQISYGPGVYLWSFCMILNVCIVIAPIELQKAYNKLINKDIKS